MEQTRHGQETLNMATPDPTEMGPVVYRGGHIPKTDCVMVGRGAACPVPAGCGYTATAWGGLRAHFQFRHPEDSIHILNKFLRPFEKCESCDIQLKNSDAKH
jgi:hypothetical protein